MAHRPSLVVYLALALLGALAATDASARVTTVYAGSWGPAGAGQGRVFRYLQDTDWQELSPASGLGDAVWDLEWVDGELWAATHLGPHTSRDDVLPHGSSGHVWRFDGSGWSEVSPPGGFATAATTVSLLDGQVFVTTSGEGLYRWEGARDWTLVDGFPKAARAIVSDIQAGRPQLYIGEDNIDQFWVHDPSGQLVCGTPVDPFGECVYPPAGTVCNAECHPGSCVHAFAEYDDGASALVYAGAYMGQFYRYETASRLFVRLPDVPVAQPFQEVHIQGLATYAGWLWAGASNGKLMISNTPASGGWQLHTDFGDLDPVSQMLAIPEDDELWVGFGGVPYRWAREFGATGVRSWDGFDWVERSEAGFFPTGVMALLAVPEIECDAGAPQTVECAGAETAVTLDASGSEVPPSLNPSYTWSGPFLEGTATGIQPTVHFEGPGDYSVTLTIEAGSLTASCETMVSIVDTQPPLLGGSETCLWPPNHRYRCLGLDQLLGSGGISAEDLCDGEVGVSIVEARSSQPEDAPDRGDGATLDDLLFDTATVCARAERQGADPAGRDYTLVLEARDAAGNSSRAQAVLHVPHDQAGDERCEGRPVDPGLLPGAELPLGPDVQEGDYPD